MGGGQLKEIMKGLQEMVVEFNNIESLKETETEIKLEMENLG